MVGGHPRPLAAPVHATLATAHGPCLGRPGAVGLCEDSGFVCGTRTGFFRFDPATGRDGRSSSRWLSSRTCTSTMAGAIRTGSWSGTVQELRAVGEALYRLAGWVPAILCSTASPSRTASRRPDDRTMYVADSHERVIYAMALDAEDGFLGDRRLFARLDEAMGRAQQRRGSWIAAIHGGPDTALHATGSTRPDITMPVSQPTSCTVTSARMRLDDQALAREPLRRNVFCLNKASQAFPNHAIAPEPQHDQSNHGHRTCGSVSPDRAVQRTLRRCGCLTMRSLPLPAARHAERGVESHGVVRTAIYLERLRCAA